MANFAFFLDLKAKPGLEAEVEAFLKSEAAIVKTETGTLAWTASKIEGEPGAYRVFDTFNNEADREAHMAGPAGLEFVANGERLFAEAKVYRMQVIAEK